MNEICPVHDTMVKLFENEFKNIKGTLCEMHESIKEISERQKTDAEKNAEAAIAALNAINIYKARKQGEDDGKDATKTEARLIRGQKTTMIAIVISILAILGSIGVAWYNHHDTKDEMTDVKKAVGPHFNKRGMVYWGTDSLNLIKEDTAIYKN